MQTLYSIVVFTLKNLTCYGLGGARILSGSYGGGSLKSLGKPTLHAPLPGIRGHFMLLEAVEFVM